jgi:Flp pilus assembly protein TadG
MQSLCSRLLRDKKGAMTAVIVAALPVFLGGLALAVDTTQWTLARRMLQRQADSGALAGAYGLAQGVDATTSVTRDLTLNKNFGTLEAPIIERGPTTGPYAGNNNAVRVALETNLNLPFAGFFLSGETRVRAQATAALISFGEVCALALDTSSATGITMTGSSIVDLQCGMAANSVGASAITGGGSSEINASPLIAAGGIPASDNFATDSVLVPYAVAQPDPFADLADPVMVGNVRQMRVQSGRVANFQPGTYRNVNIQGRANLAPGEYYIDGGSFSVGAQAELIGDGVVIILTSSTASSNSASIADVDIMGGAYLNLKAPTSGIYEGILFYQDRRASFASNKYNKINGNSSSELRGAMYFPSSGLEFTGNTTMSIDCIQLVGFHLRFNGNSTVSNVCPGNGGQAFPSTAVRLVG